MENGFGIAGAGRVAQALGRLLRERGEAVAAIGSRTREHAAAAASFVGAARAVSYSELPRYASRILIAVSDDAVANVAAELAEAGFREGDALHTCGARGPECLAALAANGVSCATLHPLQAVSTPERGVSVLPGAAYAISGQGSAAGWAERIVALLDGVALRIPAESLPLYHAAAVMASNYVVALIDAAVRLLKAAGVEDSKALASIAPLVRASTEAALTLGPARALTGPIARGDVETVALHLKALAAAARPVRGLYRAAGLQTLELAAERGLAHSKAGRLEQMLAGVS